MSNRVHGALGVGVGSLALAAGCWATFGSTSQVFGPFPWRAPEPDVGRPRVALTFDDGPNEPYTSHLLDILARERVRATFFQVGRCAERFPDVTRRVVADGHVLANHSYSHTFGTYVSRPRQVEEIERGRETLTHIAGVTPLLYRPPWLCRPPWVLASIARSGASAVSGVFGDPFEMFQPPSRWTSAVTARRTAPGSIMIMHDGRESRGGPRAGTVGAVAGVIERLRRRGFTFVTVDELLGVRAYA